MSSAVPGREALVPPRRLAPSLGQEETPSLAYGFDSLKRIHKGFLLTSISLHYFKGYKEVNLDYQGYQECSSKKCSVHGLALSTVLYWMLERVRDLSMCHRWQKGQLGALGCLGRHLAQHFLGAVPALPWGLVLQPACHRNRELPPALYSMQVQMTIFRGSSQMQHF